MDGYAFYKWEITEHEIYFKKQTNVQYIRIWYWIERFYSFLVIFITIYTSVYWML